jgi:YD repeat-containing protein
VITSLLKYLCRKLLRSPHFPTLLLLLGFAFSAQAQVNLVVPATSTNGVVNITWSGAASLSTLYEYGGASADIQRATGTAGAGSYSATRLPGTYYFYVRSCVLVSQAPPNCTNTPQKGIVVTNATIQPGKCSSFTADSSVVVVAPYTSENGSFSITWSGASTPPSNATVSSILYECGAPAPIQRASSTAPTGSYSVTGKAPGNYYFYVEDCVFPYQAAPNCKKTPQKIIAVKMPSSLNTAGEAYDYDALGRLNNVKVEGAAKTTYDYDKAGNRKSVVEP